MIQKPTKRKISSVNIYDKIEVKTFLGLNPNDEKKFNHLSTEKMIVRGKTSFLSNLISNTTRITRTSSIDQSKSKLNMPYFQNQEKTIKSSEYVDIVFTFTNKEIEEEEELLINEFFKIHPLFKCFSDENILLLIDHLTIYQIKKGAIIFKEGEEGSGFFIIKKGTAEMIGSKGSKKILSQGDSFGEMALFYKCLRLYTVVALEDMQIYMMERDFFKKFISVNNDETKMTLLHLNSVPWIKNLDVSLKNNLANVTYTKLFENEELFNLNKNNQEMYIIQIGQSGIYRKLNDGTLKKYSPFEYLGINFIFTEICDEEIKEGCYSASESTSCYVLENKYLEESLGLDYRYTIKLSYLKKLLSSTKIFISEFLETQMEEIEKIFTFKYYANKEVVYERKCQNNKKMICIIEGGLIDKNGKIIREKGDLFGEEIIISNIDLPSELFACPYCFVLESNWNKIRKLLKKLSHSSSLNIFKRVEKLKRFSILKNFSEPELIFLGNVMEKEKYLTRENIYTENSISEKIYLINSGRIYLLKNLRFVREMDEGCSFGEISVLNEENRSDSAVAASDVELYSLNKQYFFEMINDNVMEYLKNKIYLEDDYIKLDDLYYISFLGKGRFGNVCLVHNRAFLYAVKFIPKKIIEKQKSLSKYILSEKEIVLSVSHPFIVKHVKTLKNDLNLFYLMEYVNGINMEEYIIKSKSKRNLHETSFYTACLFHAVAYLHRKCILHRDIKPANIIIDKFGYIKLIDFGAAKIIKDMAYTIIGTPHYIAPEVLSGNGYAFSCDLWSIAVVMYNIYYGTLPFGNAKSDVMEVYKEILNKEVTFPDSQNFSEINIFLSNMLNKKKKNRLSQMKEISSHIVFNNINWEDLLEYKINPPFVPKDLREWINNLENLGNPLESAIKNEKFELNYMNFKFESSYDKDYDTKWIEEF